MKEITVCTYCHTARWDYQKCGMCERRPHIADEVYRLNNKRLKKKEWVEKNYWIPCKGCGEPQYRRTQHRGAICEPCRILKRKTLYELNKLQDEKERPRWIGSPTPQVKTLL